MKRLRGEGWKLITKEKWAELEQEMASYFFVSVKFRYKGHELSIQRVKVSESKTALAVYIDGTIKGSWFLPDNDRPAIIPEVWRKRSRRVFSHQKKAKIIKDFGKRHAQRLFPNMDRTIEFHDPYFTTAKSLVRQLKKLEGIELVTSLETEKNAAP